MSVNNLPWIEKYRPSSLDQLVSQKNIIKTLNKFIDADALPHLLFYGPPGSGKTSAILASAKRIYGDNFQLMVLELNASDSRGIDEVRTRIKEFSDTKNFFVSGIKLVILDEADNMTKDAQAALRRVIEKYTKNVRFCLICNYISKIIPALQSRCTRFRFSPLKDNEVLERLKDIVQQEDVELTHNSLRAVLRIGQGDMRKVLNTIQGASITHNPIKEKHIYLITGKPNPKDIDKILDALMNKNLKDALKNLKIIYTQNGLDLLDVLNELYGKTISLLKEYPEALKYFLKEAAELEYTLSSSTDNELHLGYLVSIYQQLRFRL